MLRMDLLGRIQWNLIVMVIGFLLLPVLGSANEMIRPQEYSDFEKYQRQTHYFIPGSRVAWANYAALRRDFSHLQQKSDAEIDTWIISNFAYVSELQTRLRGIRTDEYKFDESKAVTFIHPESYGRAAVALEQASQHQQSSALVDIKGTGHSSTSKVESQIYKYEAITQSDSAQKALDDLRIHDHSDGMMTLGEAIAETTRQMAVQATFDLHNSKSGSSFQTVESYFVISLPIKILKEGQKKDPAAIYGRQAHWRGNGIGSLPRETYIDDFGGKQSSIFLGSVDFGGVVITHPDLEKTFGNAESYISASTGARADAQKSNAWRYGHETAEAFIQQAESNFHEARRAVHTHVETMLSPVKEELSRLPRKDANSELLSYLDHRATINNAKTRLITIKRLMDLDPKAVITLLPKYFNKMFYNESNSWILEELLAHPNYAEGTTARKILLSYARKASGQQVSNSSREAAVALIAIRENSKKMDASSVELLVNTGLKFTALKKDVIQALEKYPPDVLVAQLPRILDPNTGSSLLSPYLKVLLVGSTDFPQRFPHWYRYLLERFEKMAVSSPHAVQLFLRYLSEKNRGDFTKVAGILLFHPTPEVASEAADALVKYDPNYLLKNSEAIAKKAKPSTMRIMLGGLVKAGHLDPNGQVFIKLAKIASTKITKLYELGDILNVSPPSAAHFKKEIKEVIAKSSDSSALNALVLLDRKAQSRILVDLIGEGYWEKEHFVQLIQKHFGDDVPSEVFNKMMDIANRSSEKEKVYYTMLEMGYLKHPISKSVPVGTLLPWLNFKSYRYAVIVAQHLADRPYPEIQPYLPTILSSRTGHHFSEYLLKVKLLAGSDERYKFLELYKPFLNEALGPGGLVVVKLMTADMEPRASKFLRYCFQLKDPNLQHLVLQYFSKRELSEIIEFLPLVVKQAVNTDLVAIFIADIVGSKKLKPAETWEIAQRAVAEALQQKSPELLNKILAVAKHEFPSVSIAIRSAIVLQAQDSGVKKEALVALASKVRNKVYSENFLEFAKALSPAPRARLVQAISEHEVKGEGQLLIDMLNASSPAGPSCTAQFGAN